MRRALYLVLIAIPVLASCVGCTEHICLDPVHPSPDCAAVWR